MWHDSAVHTIYWWSEVDSVYANTNCDKIFSINSYSYPNNSHFLDLGLRVVNTSRVETMKDMFNHRTGNPMTGPSYIKSINSTEFDTSNVANMADMFYRLDRITSLDLSNFNTSKVINMRAMFAHVERITPLNISNFNTSNVRSFPGMFQNASRLQTIKATSNFIVRDGVVSNDMFGNNIQLVGGNDATYNELSPKDKTYAHIDVPGNPGYFTQGP